MKLGSLDLTLVSDGGFRLDGGAMFGVVPRVLWERVKAPDAKNRIAMATNCLLIESGSDLLLIDTGIGDKNDARFREMFALEDGATRLPDSIRQAGYELGDITHVVLTHLHFDHCGWNTCETDTGLRPTFPKARYWLERGEVEHARQPNARDRASYDGRNWEPLFEAGVAELFDDHCEPCPGVRAQKVRGHNADMCIVLLDGGQEQRGVFWADLVPTAAHVPFPWIMGYDLYPLETLANKELWLPRAVEEGWLAIFEHESEQPLGRVIQDARGRPSAVPWEESGKG